MRHRYLITYDICDEKRLHQVHKAMIGLGDHLQYSVFLCDFSKEELVLAREKLRGLMNQKEDSVLIADLGPLDLKGRIRRGLKFMGVRPVMRDREAVVV